MIGRGKPYDCLFLFVSSFNGPAYGPVSRSYLDCLSMNRPAIRRAGTTLAPTPHKPHLTVEEWDNLTPLSSAALKSVASIKSAGEKAPLPLKVSIVILPTRRSARN